MKCANCGEEIKVGCVYCPICGKEAQIVSDINLLEDEYLSELLEEEARAKLKKQQEEKEEQEELQKAEKEEKKRKWQKRQKQKKILLLVVLFACLAAVLIAVFIYQKRNSFDGLYERAQLSYNTGKYGEAKDLIEKALDKKEDSVAGYLLLGKIYVELEEPRQAEAQFQKAIALDPSSEDAYWQLLEFYDSEGETDKIIALKADVTDEKILELFEDYLLQIPEADVEAGSYGDFLTVTLDVQTRGLDIYYTLDGSDPGQQGEKYEEPIQIDQEGQTILKAVSKDDEGNVSEVLEVVYEIELDLPEAPVISPDGGEFSSPKQIKISAPAGTTIYYTWDGSDPTKSSSKYTEALEMPEGNHVLSVIAVNDKNGAVSQTVRRNFIYYPSDDDTKTE